MKIIFSTKFILYILLTFSAFSICAVPPLNSATEYQKQAWQQSFSSAFIENKGQMKDMNNNPTPFVLFKTEAPGITMYITEFGLTYLFAKNKEEESGEKETVSAEWSRVDMILKGATIKKENVVKESESKSFSTYFLAHCKQGIENVRGYEKITIKEVYPGIDWVFYNSSETGFKYDFIVNPHANVNQINLLYEGAGKLELTNNRIHFDNPIGEMDEGKLFCYQENEKNEILSNYVVKKSETRHLKNEQHLFSYELSIQPENYNTNQILVIDPQLTWATFCGGTSVDGATTITTDFAGNVFIAGYLASNDFPLLNPGGTSYYQGTVAAQRDCFVLKLNNAGVLLWSTFYGGSSYDQADAICADASGNIFITGNTQSIDFPTLNPAGGAYFQTTNNGSDDAYILKFNNTGTLLWASYYGGSGEDLANSICVDPSGSVVIGGQTKSTNLPTMAPGGTGYYQATAGSTFDAFILKFNNTGVRQWATYFGSTGIDIGSSVSCDASGNIFFTGSTTSNNFPKINPGGTAFFQAAVAGANYDMFISKFSGTAVLLWSTLYGGTGLDEGLSICNDLAGNLFVVGKTSNNNFPTLNPGGGTFFQAAYGGGVSDATILKFNNTGTRLWATFFGGTADEGISSEKNVTIDNCQNVYVSLNTSSNTMPTMAPCITGDYFDNSHNGGKDIFLSKFSNDGMQFWGTFFGGDADDLREAIDVDNVGNLFICGEWTEQSSLSISPATYPLTNLGGGALFDQTFDGGIDDSFIAKFKTNTITSNATATPANCNCNGTATATASGGCSSYQYVWYTSSWTQVATTQTVNNLCPGSYQVIVRDSINCSLPDTAIIAVSNLGGVMNLTNTISICPGGSYTLPGGTQVNTPGTYIDTIVGGCDSIITTILNVINAFNSTVPASICSGGSYTLPLGTIVSAPGTYYDTLQSVGGCDSIITTNLSLNNPFSSTVPAFICTGGNYTLPLGSVVNSPGTYYDTLQSLSGCDSIITTILSITNAFINTVPVAICSGSNYTLPSGAIVNSAGTYYDTLQSLGGCDSIITTQLTLNPLVTSTQSPSICSGTSFTLPSGNTVSSAGTYYDTLSTVTGCDSVITTTLIINSLPTAIAGPPLQLSCTITSGSISATSNTINPLFLWAGPGIVSGANSSNATVNSTGTYTVQITNQSTGCTNTATVLVTSNTPLPTVTALPLTLPCNPKLGTINANTITANASYTWAGPGIVTGINTANPTVNVAGTYTVTVLDPATGCTNTQTIIVTNAANPTAYVSPDVTITLGSTTTLTAAGGSSYAWTPSSSLASSSGSVITASPSQTTIYCVEVANNNRCKDTACVKVEVEIPCPTNDKLQAPNAFSPNNDGVNEEFCLQGWDPCIKDFIVIIFDRWGEKVYESKDPNFCWDGKYLGIIMDAQVFVYYIRAEFINMDDPFIKKGNISLIR